MQNLDRAVALAAVRLDLASGKALARRRAARLTQLEVAAAVGASREAVSKWEAGKRVPKGDVALRYAALQAALERQLEVGGRG